MNNIFLKSDRGAHKYYKRRLLTCLPIIENLKKLTPTNDAAWQKQTDITIRTIQDRMVSELCGSVIRDSTRVESMMLGLSVLVNGDKVKDTTIKMYLGPALISIDADPLIISAINKINTDYVPSTIKAIKDINDRIKKSAEDMSIEQRCAILDTVMLAEPIKVSCTGGRQWIMDIPYDGMNTPYTTFHTRYVAHLARHFSLLYYAVLYNLGIPMDRIYAFDQTPIEPWEMPCDYYDLEEAEEAEAQTP